MNKPVTIPKGGYPYEFLDTPHDNLICKICRLPSDEPCLTECCGHTFCQLCIDYVIMHFQPCPVCRTEKFKVVRNLQNERDIKEHHVLCPNTENGCKWQGKINNVKDHCEHCDFEEVSCPKSCEENIQRRNLDEHLKNECRRREFNCQYCLLTDELEYIQGEHKEKCPRFPLPCPNDCGKSHILRENMDDHLGFCHKQNVECSCGATVIREDIDKHLDKECPCRKMECQYCQIEGEQQFIEGPHVELCIKFPLVCPNKCRAEDIFRKDMETHLKECPLEMVQCKYHNVGCGTMLARKDQQEHIQEKMEEHFSLTTSELVNTRDKLKATEQQLIMKSSSTDEVLARLQKNIEAVEIQSQHLEMKLQQTLKQIHWVLPINQRASNGKNQVFPVIIKVPEFDWKKTNEIEWYSHTFFTRENEYKMKMRLHFTGSLDTHLSVYLYMVGGPRNLMLVWPMRKRLQVKLLNQLSDTQHHSKAYTISANQSELNSVWFARPFISYDQLYNPNDECKFLDNDSIFFEVSEIF